MKLMLAKRISIFLIAIGGFNAHAQDYLDHSYERLPNEVNSISTLESFLSHSYQKDIKLIPETSIQSLTGNHHSFKLFFQGYEVHHGLVKWNDFQGSSSSVSYPMLAPRLEVDHKNPSPSIASNFYKTNRLNTKIFTSDIKWFINNNHLVKKWVIRYETDNELKEVVLENAGEILQETDLIVHDKPDTLVDVNIFNPDPLTSARQEYSSPLIDDLDRSNSALDNELFLDSIRLRWNTDEGLWKLESDYAIALDIDSPRVAPPARLNPSASDLQLNRSHKHFEYYNAFYHINAAQRRLRALGFTNLVNYPLAFDAHGSPGDQSSFVPSGAFPYLKFGDGGVDDAEDADVITHEYGHAISYSAAPGTNLGSERAALDEGFCDYFAISYSRGISDFNTKTIFDWDGHNEFWEGRTLTNTRTYPTDLERNIYDDGILWASALAEISDYISRDVANQIMINSLYSWYPYMLLSDAARLFMQSDTLLYNAAHTEIASIVFCERGLLPGCEDTLVSSLPLNDPYLGNTYDFAFNKEPLYIFPNSRAIERIEVYDMTGKLMHEENWMESEQLFYEFEGSFLKQGSFVLRLITDEEPFSFQLIRLWQ